MRWNPLSSSGVEIYFFLFLRIVINEYKQVVTWYVREDGYNIHVNKNFKIFQFSKRVQYDNHSTTPPEFEYRNIHISGIRNGDTTRRSPWTHNRDCVMKCQGHEKKKKNL